MRPAFFLVIAILTSYLSACSPDHQRVSGRWKVITTIGDGRDMTQPDSWFDFASSGKVTVTMAGNEETGTWTTEPEQSTMIVQAVSGIQTRYNYRISGDSLLLKTMAGNGHSLEFKCIRSE